MFFVLCFGAGSTIFYGISETQKIGCGLPMLRLNGAIVLPQNVTVPVDDVILPVAFSRFKSKLAQHLD